MNLLSMPINSVAYTMRGWYVDGLPCQQFQPGLDRLKRFKSDGISWIEMYLCCTHLLHHHGWARVSSMWLLPSEGLRAAMQSLKTNLVTHNSPGMIVKTSFPTHWYHSIYMKSVIRPLLWESFPQPIRKPERNLLFEKTPRRTSPLLGEAIAQGTVHPVFG